MDDQRLTTEEMTQRLGTRIRSQRLRENLTQSEVAAKAGVAERTVRALEHGRGTIETLVRVLRAINAPDPLSHIVPPVQISPMALLRNPEGPKRARRSPSAKQP